MAVIATAVLATGGGLAAGIAPAQAAGTGSCARSASPGDPDVRSLAAAAKLSRDEAARRVGWQGGVETLDTRGRSRLDGFGGAWVDAATGRVKLGVTDAAERATAKSIIAACDLGDGADVVVVRNSAASLEDAAKSLGARIAKVGAPGLRTGVDYASNSVVLHVPDFRALSAGEQALVDLALTKFKGIVSTKVAEGAPKTVACTSTNYCDPPLRGGIWMRAANVACTLGFLARSKSDNRLYALTAGHCGRGTWITKFSNGAEHVIGPVWNGQFGGNLDAEIIKVSNPTGWQPRAWVLVEASSDTTADQSYYIRYVANPYVGMRICKTGFAGGTDCGTVTETGATVTYDGGLLGGGTTVTGLGVANFCVISGDSGGPNYSAHTALGLTSGSEVNSSDCVSFFQPVAAAANALNVRVATGS